MTRIRLRYSKRGKVRFISHRDLARIWERALRKAGVAVAYTEGFAPRPKLSFGLALSVGHESLGEYLDVQLGAAPDVESFGVDALPARLGPALPVGVDVQGAATIEAGMLSLQQAVVSCTWRIEVVGSEPTALGALVDRALAADELVITRERKGTPTSDDIRSAILSLGVCGPTDWGTELEAELATQPRGLRPSELLAALAARAARAAPGRELEEGRVCRIHQWMLADGATREPIEVGLDLPAPDSPLYATPAPYAQVRA